MLKDPFRIQNGQKYLYRLQENVLEKLRELKADQAPADHPQIIMDLQTQFTALQNNHDRQAVIATFKQISTILNKIQTHLNNSAYKKGITLFKPLEQRFGFEVVNT